MISNIDEGVIKFDASDFELTGPLDASLVKDINVVRQKLFELNLIGEYLREGIGYGNVSMRNAFDEHKYEQGFIISGTQTGRIGELNGAHYTRVVGFSLTKNSVCVRGPIQASSEALTHAALYDHNPCIGAVIHVHSAKIWKGMLADNQSHTPVTVPYGTPAMADSVQEVVADSTAGCIAMAGHEDGVITYAEDLQDALALCIELYEHYS